MPEKPKRKRTTKPESRTRARDVADILGSIAAIAGTVMDAVTQARANGGALPPEAADGPPPANALQLHKHAATLGLDLPTTGEAVKAAHRKLVLLLHPDRGGDVALIARANAAKDALLASIGAA